MIAGLLQPDDGQITIAGSDLAQDPLVCKKNTGYIADRPWLYEKLTGWEYLQFIAGLYDLTADEFEKAAMKYLEMFDLSNWRHHLIEGFSHGMRQKLVMTSMLMLAPPLIVVDEPMVGLDPKSARIVKEIFKHLADQGMTVFLSTHSLEIAEELCDRIGIILNGRLLTVGDMPTLRKKAEKEELSTSNGVKTSNPKAPDLGKTEPDLEDIFLTLTGAWELQEIVGALKGKK
jgi:ABC-2 type transport system ATP-binding protein